VERRQFLTAFETFRISGAARRLSAKERTHARQLINGGMRKATRDLSYALHHEKIHCQVDAYWKYLSVTTSVSLKRDRWFDYVRARDGSFKDILSANPKSRVYIAGCGRSGTWFALGIMGTFKSSFICSEERHYGHFAAITHQQPSLHVVKRTFDAHAYLNSIPREINILYIIRDPRDVLTSQHDNVTRYITLDRWKAEIAALKLLLKSDRPNVLVVRFEDLAANAETEQARIASAFQLSIAGEASAFHKKFKPGNNVDVYMHGLRAPDASVIGRWKKNVSDIKYVQTLNQQLIDTLGELASLFHYKFT
jgi:hypothetical protein